jgi:glycosyltransferase involved in cell wall biosynthesis
MNYKCSLIISTYNWPDALELCIISVLKQKQMPFEVIVADDGSGEATKALIEKYKPKFDVPFYHVWQPDEGFQLARIRNKAIAKASGEYIVQVDGDLILHSSFIKDHVANAEQGYFVTGSRILLNASSTKKILEEKKFKNLYLISSGNIFNRLRNKLLRQYFAKRYKMHGKHKYYVKGCNMAFWKTDLLKVNGYNENFQGWGKEDSDIAIRLMNAGIKKKFIKMGGICYHLYHKEVSRELESKNTETMNDAIMNKTTWAQKGIDQNL